MIASIAFRNFKALRHTRVALAPFNLVIGPNGSGKTSLIEAMLRLRTAAQGPLDADAEAESRAAMTGPEMEFRFSGPGEGIVARLGGAPERMGDRLAIEPAGAPGWPLLREQLARIRGYVLDHEAMSRPTLRAPGAPLAPSGANLAAVLADVQERAPDKYAALTAEILRILPEFRSLEISERGDGQVEFGLGLLDAGVVPAAELSQGMLYLVAVLVLAFDPDPPSLLCIEEVDRGIHPRTLREIRDALYRLAYPASFELERRAVQIIATSHSPYFIDLFRDHPEEIVLSHKHGRAAHFSRLTDRPDLPELLREGTLGDMWFSGILGGVPEERGTDSANQSE